MTLGGLAGVFILSGYYTVTAVWGHEDPVTMLLTIDGPSTSSGTETIETTPEHPFLTADGTWVTAGELAVGDALRSADGAVGVVDEIEFVVAPQTMYNMTVADAHTYVVGDGEWVVHNACGVSRHFRLVPIHTVEAPTWVPIGKNDVGAIFMGTTRVIDVDDVESALEIYGAGTVLSGRHGGIYPLHKELKFLVEDLNLRYSSVGDISIVNFNLIARQQLMNIGGDGHIVYASWCNSNECELLLEILSQ